MNIWWKKYKLLKRVNLVEEGLIEKATGYHAEVVFEEARDVYKRQIDTDIQRRSS